MEKLNGETMIQSLIFTKVVITINYLAARSNPKLKILSHIYIILSMVMIQFCHAAETETCGMDPSHG